ncbi:hypothetical protein DLAC_01855 [Tieghemostelium lacteum]|uniref:Amino acid permease n=1 Tax=Tieghemostelium lacteum TaxID=361077 RepID=A0A152A716_TIELA|nr:hypothetical protein DLAC_01855 [Tieghemostelium lacteum]|eukprot:KYR01837.1 hypothetical protein DLAC_01855 [Tieghemostelium lacteum]
MGRSPDETQPLINGEGGSKQNYSNPYGFLYPGSGSVSTLDFTGEHEDQRVLTGTNEKLEISDQPLDKVKKIDGSDEHKIGQILATAICGNDITSSIFYTSSLCTASAGIFAPISLGIVCVVLYLFRKVYGEVGSALPLNGGAYNVLLNTTTKHVASLAAALTMISYMATAVVSGSSAMQYLSGITDKVNVYWATIALLGFFALLNLVGISESAIVAAVIFIIHMITLSILVFGGFVSFFIKRDFEVVRQNLHGQWPADYSLDKIAQCEEQNYFGKNFAFNIYFGFGAAMLGVTGFETSSNFIEQQEPGVFPKTLRNMWMIVTFFNPIISVLSLMFVPVCDIAMNNTGVLASVAEVAIGDWFKIWVGIDACLVLSGSVITSYVGVIGLVRRMALDRCLPQFLIHTNPWRKTTHWIIILFFVICSSLYMIVDGNTDTLAGVYTVAFLGVMSLFAVGNMLLKYKRSSLKREIKSPWVGVVIAFFSVLAGLVANIIRDDIIVYYFGIYFIVTAVIILTMFIRAKLLKIVLFFSQILLSGNAKLKASVFIGDAVKRINSQPIVFFASKDDPAYLNKAILYIRDNEQTNWVKIVHCYDDENPPVPALEENIHFLDKCYPKIRIDLIKVHGPFTPSTVEKISDIMNIPKNFMFIACPRDQTYPHSIGDFGGIRMVFNV